MKNRWIKKIIAINNVSLIYYFIVFIILFILDIFAHNWLLRVFSVNIVQYIFLFLIVSGVIKFFSELDTIILFIKKQQKERFLGLFMVCKRVLEDSLRISAMVFLFAFIFYIISLVIILMFPESKDRVKSGWIVWVMIVAWFIMVFSDEKLYVERKTKDTIHFRLWYLFVASIIGGIITFFRFGDSGSIAYGISFLVGCIILLLSILFLTESRDEI